MANTINWGKIYESTAWGNTDNSISWGKSYLIQKERDIAEHYSRRFIDYMSFNNALYPEYNTNNNEDMYPTKNQNFNGWVL